MNRTPDLRPITSHIILFKYIEILEKQYNR